ncbi:hypothetical protein ZIOFF_071884 [Zingiber officinale]|uniref:Uncharacterized protein n=1 Tax=Zingiber officinale TaxID=94328 RepID=A0A8J5EUM2_ZINOF|nr:hypothetical protein ZIOFF_071884 [Zingiber officinale]
MPDSHHGSVTGGRAPWFQRSNTANWIVTDLDDSLYDSEEEDIVMVWNEDDHEALQDFDHSATDDQLI